MAFRDRGITVDSAICQFRNLVDTAGVTLVLFAEPSLPRFSFTEEALRRAFSVTVLDLQLDGARYFLR
ncbi:MAG: hypothetical protein ABR543_07435 [Gemmatimonadaceae bacterium]